ncbi:MAG TPA: METTL5 family protein [Candidatus Bathyarchaeia archaeon]|nr:METTL5 family protein [Candidatus Bathyarchaeia archaeon]
MGNPAQKRLIRKLDLELFLSRIKPHPSPQASLEQYTVSEAVAATMLYLAAYTHNDIIGKTVLDLGCGTGRLALGASFLGAQLVVGVDIDEAAIKIASENSEKTGLKANTQWIVGDINAISGRFDAVLQNPPFGVQKRAADRKFLEKALEVGRTVYSLHKHPCVDRQLIKRLKANAGSLLQVSPSPFIEKFVEDHNGTVEAVYAVLMTIPRMFDFHTKTKHDFVIDLYLIRRND